MPQLPERLQTDKKQANILNKGPLVTFGTLKSPLQIVKEPQKAISNRDVWSTHAVALAPEDGISLPAGRTYTAPSPALDKAG